MKKISIISFLLISIIISAGSQDNSNQNNSIASALNEKSESETPVEVYYFHTNSRCPSCTLLGGTIKMIMDEEYSVDLESGSILFHEIDVSQPDSLEVAQKLGIVDHALLVISGDKEFDLTMDGMIWAGRDYDRFKQIVETAINKARS